LTPIPVTVYHPPRQDEGKLAGKSGLNLNSEKTVSPKSPVPRSSFLVRYLYLAGVLVSTLLVIRLARVVLAIPEADLITWDQAARANEAVLLTKELTHGQIFAFTVHLFKLNWWPPFQPLLMVPFCLVFGPSFLAFILPSFIAFPLAVFSLLFLYENVSPGTVEDKVPGFALLFSLAVTSPFLLGSATWVMTEVLGIALTFLALAFYFRGRRYESADSYRACGLLFFLLWTLKYGYGIFAGIVLALLEIGRSGEAIRPRILKIRLRSLFSKPVLFPAYVLVVFVLWVAVTGGAGFHLAGLRFSASSIYNPLMYLYQYVVVVSLIALKKNWHHVQASLKLGQKQLLLWGALPAAVFLALPDKIKAILKNVEGGKRIGQGFSFDRVGYYIRSIAEDYSLLVPVGILVLLLLGVALFKLRSAPLGIRSLIVYFATGFIYFGLVFKFRESRFLATFVPALWVISAWAAESVLHRISLSVKKILAVGVSVAALVVVFLTPLPIRKALDLGRAPGSHYPEIFRSLVVPVLDLTRDSTSVFVSGIQDSALGPLLELKLQISHYGQKDYRAVFKDFESEDDAAAAFQNIVAGKEVDTIVLYVGKNAEGNGILTKEAERLKRSGVFALLRERRYLEPVSVRLMIFKRT
jgi:hypothetical protein